MSGPLAHLLTFSLSLPFHWSEKNAAMRVATLLVCVALCVAGALALEKVRTAFFPSILSFPFGFSKIHVDNSAPNANALLLHPRRQVQLKEQQEFADFLAKLAKADPVGKDSLLAVCFA